MYVCIVAYVKCFFEMFNNSNKLFSEVTRYVQLSKILSGIFIYSLNVKAFKLKIILIFMFNLFLLSLTLSIKLPSAIIHHCIYVYILRKKKLIDATKFVMER